MQRLAELRKMKGLTQRALANALNMSESSIAMYEIAQRIPTLSRALKIAEFFDVNIENIFFANNNHDMRAKETKKSS